MIPASEIELVADAVRGCGGKRAAARRLGKPYGWVQRRMAQTTQPVQTVLQFDDEKPQPGGRIHAIQRPEWPLPPKGKVARYIFTCAQSNTKLHEEVWASLNALADHYGASIHVSTFTYDVGAYGVKSVKRGKVKLSDGEPWYDERIMPHILDESVCVAPGLVWCGEMNILPTAVRPLSGFEAYTGRKSGIFPHPKFAMESIASGKYEGAKFNYTTGTVTQRNYIAKKAGQKADFHHGYGGLLVEVDDTGAWWCRQLNADSDGVIYDLDLRATALCVTAGHRAEGITWGDIHVGSVPKAVLDASWGDGGICDTLKPRHQFFHDVLDFRSRNHHDARNHIANFSKWIEGKDDVVEEMRAVAEFLTKTSYRTWSTSVVVDSNHDNALTRWLREGDYRSDAKNAIFFLKSTLELYTSMVEANNRFHLLEWAVRELAGGSVPSKAVRFLRPDESYILCRDAHGGIECGMHGHAGPNGARGSLRSFARMGRKSNTGHGHAAGIEDGAYRAGITGALDQKYNVGPSSWSHSHIVTYANGKRAIITQWGHKWRA